jgi:hypothetical protein
MYALFLLMKKSLKFWTSSDDALLDGNTTPLEPSKNALSL